MVHQLILQGMAVCAGSWISGLNLWVGSCSLGAIRLRVCTTPFSEHTLNPSWYVYTLGRILPNRKWSDNSAQHWAVLIIFSHASRPSSAGTIGRALCSKCATIRCYLDMRPTCKISLKWLPYADVCLIYVYSIRSPIHSCAVYISKPSKPYTCDKWSWNQWNMESVVISNRWPDGSAEFEWTFSGGPAMWCFLLHYIVCGLQLLSFENVHDLLWIQL